MRQWIRLIVVVCLALASQAPLTTAQGEWRAWEGGRPFAALAATSDGSTIYAVGGDWVVRSTDGGQVWQQLASPPGATELRLVAVDPADARVVYVADHGPGGPALARSDDGGQTWQTVYTGDQGRVSALTVASQPAHLVAIGVGHRFPSEGMAVLISDNQGSNWREVWRGQSMMGAGSVTSLSAPPNVVLAGLLTYHSGGLTVATGLGQGWTLAQGAWPTTGFAAPAEIAQGPQVGSLYLRWTSNGPFVLAALRKTIDYGQTWQDITPPLRGVAGEQATQEFGGPHLTALAVDPRTPGHLFAAGQWCDRPSQGSCAPGSLTILVQVSRDDGATWQTLGAPPSISAINALLYSPAHATLIAATDQGLWRVQPPVTATNIAVAGWFSRYYAAYDGPRLLGQPLQPPTTLDPWPAQLFEKGRVEDHSAVERDPAWHFMYGLLVDELVATRSPLPVGGDRSSLTYADLAEAAADSRLIAPPPGFGRGTIRLANGNIFVPLHPHLDAAPGHTIPPVFWTYINRADLFPGGWLHDLGLPITEPLTATVDKGDSLGRRITVQAFQRTVLTYDSLNPNGWQVERANVGRDYLTQFGPD